MVQLFSEKWRENYSMKPSYFWGWIILLITIGMFGFWVPLIFNTLNNKEINLGSIIINGSLSSFSIVILIESLLTGSSLPKSAKASHSLLAITCLLITLHCLMYGFIVAGTHTVRIKIVVLVLTIISIFVSILFYQFKNLDLEEGADIYIARQNDEVEIAILVSSENPIP